MLARRIAIVVVLFWSALCLALAGFIFFNLHRMESPERYLALAFGVAMLYMGGSLLAGVIWPPKPKDPNAPIEIPPLDRVRGRTSYLDDSTMTRNAMLVIGAIFLAASLGAARQQPIVLVISVVAAGVLAGAGVKIWQQKRYGRARLELQAPARRGDVMHGVITTSGSGWIAAGRGLGASVEVRAIRTFRRARSSRSVVVARSHADLSFTRDGDVLTIRYTVAIPLIDTSEGRFSWNVQLETHEPQYRATFLVDVA